MKFIQTFETFVPKNLKGRTLSDQYQKIQQDRKSTFVAHGTYTVSNSMGYEIMLSEDGEMAMINDGKEITDWLSVEYGEVGDGPIIDPEGYNIPLNMVMRINR